MALGKIYLQKFLPVLSYTILYCIEFHEEKKVIYHHLTYK